MKKLNKILCVLLMISIGASLVYAQEVSSKELQKQTKKITKTVKSFDKQVRNVDKTAKNIDNMVDKLLGTGKKKQSKINIMPKVEVDAKTKKILQDIQVSAKKIYATTGDIIETDDTILKSADIIDSFNSSKGDRKKQIDSIQKTAQLLEEKTKSVDNKPLSISVASLNKSCIALKKFVE